MIPSGRQLLKHVAKLFDVCALLASFLCAMAADHPLPEGMTMANFLELRISLGNCLLFALLTTIWYNVLKLRGLYISKRLTTRSAEMVEVCKAAMIVSLVLLSSAKLLHVTIVRPTFALYFWLFSTCLMISGRLAARSLLRILRRRGRNSRFVLIVGTNERAIEFADQLVSRPELGYHIVGFVDNDWTRIRNFETTGHARCSDFSGLAEFLRYNVVDEAAIYLPLRSYYEHALELVALCQQHGIAIRFDSQIFNAKTLRSHIPDMDDDSRLLTVNGSTEFWPALVKRVTDCVVSVLLLILCAPLLLIAAALVRFTSPGPILFRQTRVGLNKRQFKMYKFRTMIVNAEQAQDQLLPMNEMDGPAFKIKQDPRITPLGRILRRTSIDELPQLLNVLKGDMSLVGPRAMSLRDYRLFDQDWHRRRLSVKPGITCLWQINGRNSLPFEKWMELDMQYIDRWSLWLDLEILARTVPAVLRGGGAA